MRNDTLKSNCYSEILVSSLGMGSQCRGLHLKQESMEQLFEIMDVAELFFNVAHKETQSEAHGFGYSITTRCVITFTNNQTGESDSVLWEGHQGELEMNPEAGLAINAARMELSGLTESAEELSAVLWKG